MSLHVTCALSTCVDDGVYVFIARCRGSWLTFEQSQKRIWVMNVETPPSERHKGQARAMVEWLMQRAKKFKLPIDWGVFTEDGKKYIETIIKQRRRK